ncbi:unnamed protein product [Arabidopsis halleri]
MMKEEEQEDIMTLDDGGSDEIDVKIPSERLNNDGNYTFDFPMMSQPQRHRSFQMIGGGGMRGMRGMRGKRGRVMTEAMDKAAAQRQKRMDKAILLVVEKLESVVGCV